MTRLRMLMAAGSLAALVSGMGCSSDSVLEPAQNGADMFWAVRLNHHSITMATGETLQLATAALTPTGQPFPNAGTPVYHSSDTTKVFVDANGLVTARATATNIMLTTTIQSTQYNITNADTAYINVTATPQAIASFSIQPADSTILGAGSSLTLMPAIKDGGGTDVGDIVVRYGSADPGALFIDPTYGSLDGRRLGKTKVWAEATAYGVTYTDTVEMTVTYPVQFEFDFYQYPYNDPNAPVYLSDAGVTVRVNATVTFSNGTETPISVTFDHTDGIEGGNIPAFTTDDGDQTRKFTTLGTYQVSTSINQSAKIVVVQ